MTDTFEGLVTLALQAGHAKAVEDHSLAWHVHRDTLRAALVPVVATLAKVDRVAREKSAASTTEPGPSQERDER
jgi:hypothetical protein